MSIITRSVLQAVAVVAMTAGRAWGQSSPEELASRVAERWVGKSQSEFEKLFPFADGRREFAESTQRIRGLGSVVRKSAVEAIVLLSGVPSRPNSGDATLEGIGYSGVYRARPSTDGWRLEAPISLDDLGTLSAHALKVNVHPGAGIVAEDRMHVVVKGTNGFAVRLNYAAKVEAVRSQDRDVPYRFGGGLLWADLPAGEGELSLRYSLDVPADPNTSNSACFLEAYGHIRNQFLWHPILGLETGDWASFDLEIRIPAQYQLSASLPQSEQVEGGERVVRSQTPQRAFALTLVYEREWAVEHRRCDAATVDILMVPGTKPDPAAVGNEFCFAYGLLSRRFGRPAGDRFSAVQARSWQESPGWRFTSNTIVVAAANPGILYLESPIPRASLAHEVAHLWTEGASGPAMSFLSEGWAVWAESLVLEEKFGPPVMKTFWRTMAVVYLMAKDGKGSLLEDRNNSGIAYMKGPWIYRMLQDAIGVEAFDHAMTEYWAGQTVRRQGWEDLARTVQKYAPQDFDARQFLLPWLTGTRAPHVTAELKGGAVILHTEPADFILPVTVEATTGAGTERRRVWVRGATTPVSFPSAVTEVKIDPDGLLLIH